MISPRHPQKLAPPMCFQTMVACLRTTTDSEQRPPRVHGVFKWWREKLIVWTYSSLVTPLILAFTKWNIHLGSLLRVSESVVGLKQPTRAWKHIGGTLGWLWWAWMLKGINLSLIPDLKQLRKLNLFKNCDFHNHFTFLILSEWPCMSAAMTFKKMF